MKLTLPDAAMRQWILGLGLAITLATASTSQAWAGDAPDNSLHASIDRLIEGGSVAPAVPVATDAEFLRRVTLDLTGVPPSVEELRAFLADSSADKRAKAIDRLLASPLYGRHMATLLDIMLMERRPNTNISADDWHQYLLKAVRSNKPLNLLLSEILAADGADPNLRPAVRFYLDRGAEPNLLTRDVGRIFFGRDMQCAQCHNHPLIEDYQQTDYQGLLAFINPGYALTLKEAGKDKVVFAEKAGTDVTFDSVFVKNDKHLTAPRLPGETEIEEPAVTPGEEYSVKAADTVRPVPKVSRRLELARLATSGKNRAFNENVANRLWALMMGRGLVHPVDLHHPGNPAANPELMKLLGERFAAMNFNSREFLRELALTRTYQKSIDWPSNPASAADNAPSLLADLKKQTETQKAAIDAAQKAYGEATKAWFAAETAMLPAVTEQDQALAKFADSEKKRDAASKAVADSQAQVDAKQSLAKTLADTGTKALEVAKQLPAEKDLAAAAQKFVDRSTALTAEVAGLKKATAEKTVALKKANDELATLVKPVELARAKVKPLRALVHQKEQVVLDLRQKLAASRVAFETSKRRLGAVEALASLKTLEQKSLAADQALVAKRAELTRAQTFASELTAGITAKQNAVKAAEQTLQLAEKAQKDAQAALDRQKKVVESVTSALVATQAAAVQEPGDPVLAEVVKKLKDRTESLMTSVVQPQAQREAAVVGLQKATANLEASKKSAAELVAEKARRDRATTEVQTSLVSEETALKTLRSELIAERRQLETTWSNDFALAQLKPLTPEQMCWSILKVTGVYDRYRETEEAELNKTKPLTEQAKKDPAQLAARTLEVEQRTFDKLKPTVPAFISIYAAAAGQPQNDFFATADQALFVANGGSVNSWVGPAAGNVSARIIAEKDPKKAAEDLYLTVFSRSPSPEETADVAKVLNEQAKDKPAAVQELVWALLMSVEFRFNH